MPFDPNKPYKIIDKVEETPDLELQTPSKSEAAVMGAAEGISWGADQLLAGASGTLGYLAGQDSDIEKQKEEIFKKYGIVDPDQLQSIKDVFYDARDTYRKKKEAAAEEHPGTYYSSLVGGGLLTPGTAKGIVKVAEAAMAKKALAKAAEEQAAKALLKTTVEKEAVAPLLEVGAKEGTETLAQELLAKEALTAIPKKSLQQKIIEGVKTGAKVGAVTGAVGGEAKLGEGEVEKLVEDIGYGTVGGGLIGAGLPVAGTGIKKGYEGVKSLAKMLPGTESIQHGFNYGVIGKVLNEKQVKEDIESISEIIYKGLEDYRKKYNLDKKALQTLAEEAGLSISAGETVENSLKRILEKEAIGTNYESNVQFMDAIKKLYQDVPLHKKLEEDIAKKVVKKRIEEMSKQEVADIANQKAALKQAIKSEDQPFSTDENTTGMGAFFDEEATSPIAMRERTDIVEVPDIGHMGKPKLDKTGKEILVNKKKINIQDVTPYLPSEVVKGVDKETGLPYVYSKDEGTGKVISSIGKEVDTSRKIANLNKMTLNEAQQLLSEVNNYTGADGTTPKIDNAEVVKEARKLASELNAKINETIDKTGELSGLKGKASSLLSGMERAGVSDRTSAKNIVDLRDRVDKLRNLITNQGDKAEIDRDRFFQYLGEAGFEKAGKLEAKVQELNKLKELVAEQKGGGSTTSPRGLLGSARSIAGRTANIAGLGINKVTGLKSAIEEKASDKLTKMSKGLDKFISLSEPEIGDIAARLKSQGGAAAQFAGPLMKAAASSKQSKTAIMVGLYQQPAFREVVRNLGESTLQNLFGEEKEE